MPKLTDRPALYAAAERFVAAALRADDSLFTPGRAIWSPPQIDDLYARFVEHPDPSNDSFIVKFERQLHGAPQDTVQLAGELLFVHLLMPTNMKAPAKAELIRTVLSWSSAPVEIPADVASALDDGVGNIGIAMTHRPFQLWFLLELLKLWKSLGGEERRRALEDPFAFKALATSVPGHADQVQREAVLHLVHPDAFEPILSLADKRRIAQRFAEYIRVPDDDVDRQIQQIRAKLTEQVGPAFNFYDPAVRPLWSSSSPPLVTPPPKRNGKRVTQAFSTLNRLAEGMLLPTEFLQRIDGLLRDKGQVILYGPPGTCKTFVARQLAEYYARDSGGDSVVVQFHPSYSYEDFVEGYRPFLHNGQPGFVLRPGPLMRLATKAATNPDGQYVLLVDEINRGNLTKVFGELYYLLEYRGEPMQLQYAEEDEEPFALPPNLWIIGTMNTADRSIALIDAALRRRFYFVPFYPDEPPLQGLLKRWLAKHAPAFTWLAGVVDAANDELGNRHAAIGPSYFMRPGLTEEQIQDIWEHAILPYVEEQRFGDEQVRDLFSLDRLRHKVKGEPAAPEAATAATDDANAHPQ